MQRGTVNRSQITRTRRVFDEAVLPVLVFVFAMCLSALLLGMLAMPAGAATITEVRIGPHPTFTRVVFQLDRPAGYRIERESLSDGRGRILVTSREAIRLAVMMYVRCPPSPRQVEDR